jgi:hypothetical protein
MAQVKKKKKNEKQPLLAAGRQNKTSYFPPVSLRSFLFRFLSIIVRETSMRS